MRTIVCGGRSYADRQHAEKCLDALHEHEPFTHVITGGATGADAIGKAWAKSRGIPHTEFPAEWNKHGRAAGPIRNAQMISQGMAQRIVAFPGGAGTKDMIDKARASGLPVVVS